MGIDHDSKVAIATWLEMIWTMRENSYNNETHRYKKTIWECVQETVPSEDIREILYVLACNYSDSEKFTQKYSALRMK